MGGVPRGRRAGKWKRIEKGFSFGGDEMGCE